MVDRYKTLFFKQTNVDGSKLFTDCCGLGKVLKYTRGKIQLFPKIFLVKRDIKSSQKLNKRMKQ